MSYPLSTAEAVLRRFEQECVIDLSCHFYCLPLRRYWDDTNWQALRLKFLYFYCLPLRRYWDSRRCLSYFLNEAFLLSTAEAVLRHCWRWIQQLLERISIVYRWGGIETIPFFYLLIIRERYTWWQRKALFQEQTMQTWLIRNKGRNSVIM